MQCRGAGSAYPKAITWPSASCRLKADDLAQALAGSLHEIAEQRDPYGDEHEPPSDWVSEAEFNEWAQSVALDEYFQQLT
jgi:hypothetical protein